MSLSLIIEQTFKRKLDEYGIEVINQAQAQSFKAILSSYNLDTEFDLDDQDLSRELIGVVLKENSPKTGDILLINERKFIVKSTETRPNSPLFRFTASEK